MRFGRGDGIHCLHLWKYCGRTFRTLAPSQHQLQQEARFGSSIGSSRTISCADPSPPGHDPVLDHLPVVPAWRGCCRCGHLHDLSRFQLLPAVNDAGGELGAVLSHQNQAVALIQLVLGVGLLVLWVNVRGLSQCESPLLGQTLRADLDVGVLFLTSSI